MLHCKRMEGELAPTPEHQGPDKSTAPPKWHRRYTTTPVALEGAATPPVRLFPQFRGCRRGVAAIPPPPPAIRPCHTPSRTPCKVSRLFWKSETRAHAKGVVLSEKACFCLRCAFSTTFLEPLLRTLLRTLPPFNSYCKTPSKNPS